MLAIQQNILDALGRTLGDVPVQDRQIDYFLPKADRAIKDFVGTPIEQASYSEYYPSSRGESRSDDDALITGWEMQSGKAVAYQRGDGARRVVQLLKLPVRSVTSVYENAAAWAVSPPSFPASSLLDPASYQLDVTESGLCLNGQLLRRSGAWTTAARAILITYVAGWSPAELDPMQAGVASVFNEACVRTVIAWVTLAAIRNRAMASGGMIRSQSLDGYSATAMTPAEMGPLIAVSDDLPQDVKRMLTRQVDVSQFI